MILSMDSVRQDQVKQVKNLFVLELCTLTVQSKIVTGQLPGRTKTWENSFAGKIDKHQNVESNQKVLDGSARAYSVTF